MKNLLMTCLILGWMAAAQAQTPADINVAEPNAAAPDTDQMNDARTLPAQSNPADPSIAQPKPAWDNTGQMNDATVVPAWINKPAPDAADPNVD